MEEQFELHVAFNGKDITLPASFIKFGYTYRIEIEVNKQILCFDKDEQQEWRVAVAHPGQQLHKSTTNEMLQSIIKALEKLS